MMIEKTLVVGAFQCNCRLLVCPETGEGVLVDPGDDAKKIIQAVQATKTPNGASIQIKYLLHTHGHLDHVGASRAVRESMSSAPPKIALHRGDEPLYKSLKLQGQHFGIQYDDPLPIDHYLEDEEEIRVGRLKFSMIHTPGHSPGSVCMRLHEDSAFQIPEVLFSGDTLFKGSVGRTDLWGSDQGQLFKSIRQRIFSLDGDTRVCPGHGKDTSVGIEKTTNPFVKG